LLHDFGRTLQDLMIPGKNYEMHYKFSSAISRLCFMFLKKVGVKPVTFLNWLDKWATLL
jgi:hypothetical protein